MPLSLVDLPAELLHTIALELHAPDEDRWDIYYRKQENCRKDVVSLSQADSHLRLVCLPFIFETLLLAEEKDQRAKFGFGQTTLVGRLGKIVQTPHIVRCVKYVLHPIPTTLQSNLNFYLRHVVIERTNIEEDANILVWASVWKFPMLETIRCVGLSTVFSSPKFLNAVGEHLRLQKVYSDHIPLASPAQYSSNAVLCSAMAKIVFDSTPSTDGGALLLSSTNNTQLLSWLSHGATVESMRFRQQSTAVTWMSSHLSYFEHLRELHLTSVCDATLTPLLLPIMERHPALIVHLDSRNTTAGHPMFLSLVQHSGALQGTELSLEDISVLQDITNSSLWKHGASAPMCLKTIMSRFSDEYVGPALDLLRMLVIALPSLEELNVYMMVMDERDDEALTTLQVGRRNFCA